MREVLPYENKLSEVLSPRKILNEFTGINLNPLAREVTFMISLTFKVLGKTKRAEESQEITMTRKVITKTGEVFTKQVKINHRPLVQDFATQKTLISDEAQAFFQSEAGKPQHVKPAVWKHMGGKERLELHLSDMAGGMPFEYEVIK